MKTYDEFHGNLLITEIGKRLREIVKIEETAFKIITGYGSTYGKCESKHAAIKSLAKMKKEGMIKDFFPGDVKNQLLNCNSKYYEAKQLYGPSLKNDTDYGNDGVIFVFLK